MSALVTVLGQVFKGYTQIFSTPVVSNIEELETILDLSYGPRTGKLNRKIIDMKPEEYLKHPIAKFLNFKAIPFGVNKIRVRVLHLD